MNRLMVVLLAALAMLSGAESLAANPSREELQARFQQRHPHVLKLKEEARAGETWKGFVEVVDGKRVSASERRLLDEENADRTVLYRIIAEEAGPQVSPATVGVRNGKRNFSNAKPSHYLLREDGKWVQKRDLK
jgi:uncharacterized protein YdbL (DUF1318 family)